MLRRSAEVLRGLVPLQLSWLLAFASFALLLVIDAPSANALPAFARQTGQPCGACHTAIPELRPFGRLFKLGGYQLSDGEMMTPQLALWMMPQFTHTRANQDTPPVPGKTGTNNNAAITEFHPFVAGKIAEDLGGFIQWTVNGFDGHINFDDTDIRYVKNIQLFGADAIIGVTANNAPTLEDVWNTTNNWSWPQFNGNDNGLANVTLPSTFIDTVDQQVGGAGMYLWWNNVFYMEAAGYGGFDRKTLNILGQEPGTSPPQYPNPMPYWRIAFEPKQGDNYFMFGAFGMYGDAAPGGVTGSILDHYLDIGVDSQYQYDGDEYQFTLKTSNVYEKQTLDSSFANGIATNRDNWLNLFKINATSIWDHTYSLSAGYFNVSGSTDANLWGFGTSAANTNFSTVGSPNTDGLIFDASYFPFSKKQAPGPDKQFNMRIGVQYTKYLHLYGGTNTVNATGGTRNASGNDTLWLYALTAF